MTPNDVNLNQLFLAFNAAFNKSLVNSQTFYKDVAMIVPSTASGNNYGWLGAMPRMREWVGDRLVTRLSAHTYTLLNRTFENTVAVKREVVEDDLYGAYGPVFERLGMDAAQHPDLMVFGLLANGMKTKCYDGQNFFDPAHPVGASGITNLVSNFQAGDTTGTAVSASGTPVGLGPAWFLLDCSQPIKPMIFQERLGPILQARNQETDPNVFWQNEYVYGVRTRCNVGYGIWQLAYASTAALTPDNYAAARAAMMSQVSDTGRPLGIKPTHLVTVPANKALALKLLRSTLIASTTNEWAGSAIPVVTQFLLNPPQYSDAGSASAT